MGTLITVGVVVGLYALGRWGWVLGAAGNPPTATVGTNSSQENCSLYCSQLRNRRQERCNREKDELAARSRADALRSQLWSALGTAAALVGSAIAAANTPRFLYYIVGWSGGRSIVAALSAAAAVFFALVTVLAGQLGAAEADLAAKARATQAARDAEAEALRLLGENCPTQEIDTCLRTLTC